MSKQITFTEDEFTQISRFVFSHEELIGGHLRQNFGLAEVWKGNVTVYGLDEVDLFRLQTFAGRLGNVVISDKVRKVLCPNTFLINDEVSWAVGSDVHCGHVVKVTNTQVHVVEAETKLLNGSGSGEPDALVFTPGGFVGHTSGEQRWEVKPGSGEPIKFTLRKKTGRFVQGGANYVRAPYLWHGARPHRDFNF